MKRHSRVIQYLEAEKDTLINSPHLYADTIVHWIEIV